MSLWGRIANAVGHAASTAAHAAADTLEAAGKAAASEFSKVEKATVATVKGAANKVARAAKTAARKTVAAVTRAYEVAVDLANVAIDIPLILSPGGALLRTISAGFYKSKVGSAVTACRSDSPPPPKAPPLRYADAKEAAEVAYHPKIGEKTKSGRFTPKEVHVDDRSGFQAVVLTPTNGDDQPVILAFAGTDPLSLADVRTDLDQEAGRIPEQYREARELTAQLKEQYGDDLVLAGHSLGGGLVQYAGAMNGVPGIGLNSAPLGFGTLMDIALNGPADGPSGITTYRTESDPVSAAPGELIGTVHDIPDNGNPFTAHFLGSFPESEAPGGPTAPPTACGGGDGTW